MSKFCPFADNRICKPTCACYHRDMESCCFVWIADELCEIKTILNTLVDRGRC